MIQDRETVIKAVANGVDACTLGVTICAFTQWLPPIAAVLSIIWLVIRISDWAYIRFIKKGGKHEHIE